MSASSSDDMNLRAAVDALREAVAQIAELHDVLVVEFGGHRDTEGAVGAAIRILREQRTAHPLLDAFVLRGGAPPRAQPLVEKTRVLR